MLLVIVGPNVLSARQKLHDLRNAFVQKYGNFAVEVIDCGESDLNRIRESLQSAPFLASSKMVILESPGSLKPFMDDYKSILESAPDSTDIVVYEPVPDKRTAYYKYLKSQKQFYEYPSLDERTLAEWLVETARQAGGSISRPDAAYLVDRVNSDQYGLKNELDKLLSYKPEITRDSIHLLTEPSPKTTIFELLDAALSGRTKRVLEIYAEQRQLKVEPQQILAMLAWQLHILAVVAAAAGKSDSVIARTAKLSPYVVGKSRPLLKHIGIGRLKQLLAELTEFDYQTKTSAVDTDRGLRTFLASIS